jgi:hypothetical protein
MFVSLDMRTWPVVANVWDAVTGVSWWRGPTWNWVSVRVDRDSTRNRPLPATALGQRDGGDGEG